MDKFKVLKRNTIIIAIASLGSKVIGFILAPLYSYYMTISQYGVMDIIITTVGLLLPLVTFNIYEATFRFTTGNKSDENQVLTLSLLATIVGLILSTIALPIIMHFTKMGEIVLLTYLLIFVESINFVLKQFARGLGKVEEFAWNGIIASFITLGFSLILMVLLHMGLEGYLITIIISYFLTNIYLFIRLKLWKCLIIKKINWNILREMLRYSVPLMPITSMWWIINVSDRYVIGIMLGTAYNGIYAVASKLPSLLSVFEDVFYQAWQMSAIKEASADGENEFYSLIFNNYIIILTIGFTLLLVIVRPMVIYLFSNDYYDAWRYVPLLLVATVFHALSGFLGVFYTVKKKPKGALISVIVGAGVNIALNIILIPLIGLMGAAVATIVAYIIVTIYRFIDTKKFVTIALKEKYIVLMTFICLLQLVIYYLSFNFKIAIQLLIASWIVVCNRRLILQLVKRNIS